MMETKKSGIKKIKSFYKNFFFFFESDTFLSYEMTVDGPMASTKKLMESLGGAVYNQQPYTVQAGLIHS